MNYVSAEALDVYKDYRTEFFNSNNVLKFVEESLLYEDMVLENNKISSRDKEILLGIMSTARIGAQYWGSILHNK